MSMNCWCGVGRLSADPELRRTADGKAVVHATIAVDRDYKQDGKTIADFVELLIWGQIGEQFAKYFRKGRRVAVEGPFHNNKFLARDGTKRNRWEVKVEKWHFIDNASENPPESGYSGYGTAPDADGFSHFAETNRAESEQLPLTNYPEITEEDGELPF